MFSLLGGCYEWLARKEELHILMVGLDDAGKTLTLERLKVRFFAAQAGFSVLMLSFSRWLPGVAPATATDAAG